MHLADLGADVIKIEDPRTGGDVGRYVPPYQEGEDSLFFETFCHNKRSVSLDLRHPEARPVFEDLVRAVRRRLLQPARRRAREAAHHATTTSSTVKPEIVCCSLSGFGMTGPARRRGRLRLRAAGHGGLDER